MGDAWVRQEYEMRFRRLEGAGVSAISSAPGGGRGSRRPAAGAWAASTSAGAIRSRPCGACSTATTCSGSAANATCARRRCTSTPRPCACAARDVVRRPGRPHRDRGAAGRAADGAPGDNDIRAGIAAVTARLRTGRLKVLGAACPNLLAEARLYRYPTAAERVLRRREPGGRAQPRPGRPALPGVPGLDAQLHRPTAHATGGRGRPRSGRLVPGRGREDRPAVPRNRRDDERPVDEANMMRTLLAKNAFAAGPLAAAEGDAGRSRPAGSGRAPPSWTPTDGSARPDAQRALGGAEEHGLERPPASMPPSSPAFRPGACTSCAPAIHQPRPQRGALPARGRRALAVCRAAAPRPRAIRAWPRSRR